MARRRPRGRDISGIVLLDKPLGMTSNAALQRVKRLFNANKAGHTGSLDPLASGLLPICLGEATKISSYLLDSDKAYSGTCKLGVTTTTADAEGEILEQKPVAEYSPQQITDVLAKFTGTIEQIPPMHSAIKQGGQPLYKLAHQGIEVERQARTIHIHELRAIRLEGDELEIDIRCSKGTYVRTLAEDIGRELGCGAHLNRLRRTKVGPFMLDSAIELEALEQLAEQGFEELDRQILPIEEALADWPEVQLTENSAFYLCRGQAIQVPQAPTGGLVRLSANQRFLGIGEILDDGRVAPKRLLKSG
ncbi:MAG: tRNA pseudouridine(55) synthase TruB [Gammaproteobacteria bacterium]|nr:tRNA pseudouridine(55) synthase TruB [Gammaproteobacteria bacterium]